MKTQKLLKLISLLLQYPDKEIYSLHWDNEPGTNETLPWTENLKIFADYFHNNTLEALQENYVQTFDFNDKANLYLTYSQNNKDKERGKALAELKEIYSVAGFELESTELPDYLPLMLEFVFLADKKISMDLLLRFRDPIVTIHQNLSEQNSPYAALFAALLIIIEHLTVKEVLS
jgi:nitrate reductase delta subunit